MFMYKPRFDSCISIVDCCFQIVMEYCGAGSVSDIMRMRQKTVSVTDENSAQPGCLKTDTIKHLLCRIINCILPTIMRTIVLCAFEAVIL